MHAAGRCSTLALLAFCLLCCGQKAPEEELRAALRLTVIDSFAGGVNLKVEVVNAQSCFVLCLEESETAPDAQTVRTLGKEIQPGKVSIEGLKPQTSYIAYGVAVSKSGKSGKSYC